MGRWLILSLFIGVSIGALQAQDTYFIGFTDKNDPEYSIDNPQAFLSQRSVERRNRQGIEIAETDLPVNQLYVSTLKENGATIRYALKWFNGAVADIPSPDILENIVSLDFVSTAVKIFDASAKRTLSPEDEYDPVFSGKADPNDHYFYGSSATQIKMMNGHKLHNSGYRGQGMLIAVLDAGFKNADNLPAFDSLWARNGVVFTRDFADAFSDIFAEHSHGTLVLSALAGNIPGQLVGTAPEAHYALIRTENTNYEQLIEEYNWAAGVELADSLGADIVQSSLGYYEFDVEGQNHTFSNMDGQSTPCAIMANMAMNKGMLVVASAGNEAQTEWQRIITPSDAMGCLGIGAVDKDGKHAPFSSIGPSFDGRVKPDVTAMGVKTVVQNPYGEIATANGTSLSAPLVAGLSACLWQKYSNLTAAELKELIIQSGSLYNAPTPQLGYGIPNFGMYATSLTHNGHLNQIQIFPNPTDTVISFMLPRNLKGHKLSIRGYSSTGALILNEKDIVETDTITIGLPSHLSRGIYLVFVCSEGFWYVGKFVKEGNQ